MKTVIASLMGSGKNIVVNAENGKVSISFTEISQRRTV